MLNWASAARVSTSALSRCIIAYYEYQWGPAKEVVDVDLISDDGNSAEQGVSISSKYQCFIKMLHRLL